MCYSIPFGTKVAETNIYEVLCSAKDLEKPGRTSSTPLSVRFNRIFQCPPIADVAGTQHDVEIPLLVLVLANVT
jgi:hypothetical protein